MRASATSHLVNRSIGQHSALRGELNCCRKDGFHSTRVSEMLKPIPQNHPPNWNSNIWTALI
eukprot:1993105-Amphidinium_carterae.1